MSKESTVIPKTTAKEVYKITKMISLDTSSVCSGWAYWENGILTDHGVIDTSLIKYRDKKLDNMCKNLIHLLKAHDPDIVVIEMTVVPNNAETQRILSEIVGVVSGWCLSQRKSSFFYRIRPNEWRKIVCNDNEKFPHSKKAGLKEWDIQKAKDIFGFDPIDDNEADAVLMGYAYNCLFG